MGRKKVTKDVLDNRTPKITDDVQAEAAESVEGSAELPIEISQINEPSDSLPAIPFQAETFSPTNLPPELAPEWVAPSDWGLEEWVARTEKLAYWANGVGRLDALLTKLWDESLWHCRDSFRQRKEQIKAESKKFKGENLTWTKLLTIMQWDRATVSRRIKFYLKHRNTPMSNWMGSPSATCGRKMLES